jgi:predicted nucleic acid-binding protein
VAAVVLDTTVLIDYLRGRPATMARLEGLRPAGDVPYVCAVSVEETIRGIRDSELVTAKRLFEGLRTARLGKPEGERAGEWRREYAARGQTLAQADCLIAAAAHAISARIATGNPKDFPMPELTVEHWPAGE